MMLAIETPAIAHAIRHRTSSEVRAFHWIVDMHVGLTMRQSKTIADAITLYSETFHRPYAQVLSEVMDAIMEHSCSASYDPTIVVYRVTTTLKNEAYNYVRASMVHSPREQGRPQPASDTGQSGSVSISREEPRSVVRREGDVAA